MSFDFPASPVLSQIGWEVTWGRQLTQTRKARKSKAFTVAGAILVSEDRDKLGERDLMRTAYIYSCSYLVAIHVDPARRQYQKSMVIVTFQHVPTQPH